MNTTIESLKTQLNDVMTSLNAIETAMQKEYNTIFAVDEDIKTELERLEDSSNLFWDERGEISVNSPIETAMILKYEHCLPFLHNYLLEEHGASLYVKTHQMSRPLGPCLIFDPEGDVYDQDSGRVVISNKEYATQNGYDHNKIVDLIEIYQTVQGVFNPIVMAKSTGYLGYLSLKKVEEKHNEKFKKGTI